MNELQTLYEQLKSGQLTKDEHLRFTSLLASPQHEEQAKAILNNIMLQLQQQPNDALLSSEALQIIRESIYMADDEIAIPQQQKIKRISVSRYWWAAAILILAIGSGIYYFNNPSYQSQKSNKSQFRQKTQASILPGTDKAIWTLSNGKQIELDSTMLDMTSKRAHIEKTGYNELRTPRGGQYQLILPDGSKAWLNAASSIKYPVAFDGKERRVDITGEVYFEITKDATKPFKVNANGQEIEVLGTSFNINAYDNEPFKTSLVEGAIKINQFILKPGQAYTNGKIVTTNVVQDLAWKNGLFNFENLNLKELMRQVERWYDVEVVYPSQIPNIAFYGTMKRNTSLNDLLEAIEKTGIRTRLEEPRRIVILP